MGRGRPNAGQAALLTSGAAQAEAEDTDDLAQRDRPPVALHVDAARRPVRDGKREPARESGEDQQMERRPQQREPLAPARVARHQHVQEEVEEPAGHHGVGRVEEEVAPRAELP